MSDNSVASIRAVCTSFIVLTTLAVALRLLSAAVVRSPSRSYGGIFWWDDWFALGGTIFSIALLALVLHWTTIGLGQHENTISPDQVTTGFKILYSSYFIYDTAISLPKLAALFFYARIFVSDRRFRVGLWTTGGLVIAWWFQAVIEAIFQCNPIDKAWELNKVGYCLNTGQWYLASALSSVFIDAIILLMPLPMLWKLQLKWIKKLGITLVFISGYTVIGISLGRLAAVAKAGSSLSTDLTCETSLSCQSCSTNSPDNIVSPGYWMVVEGPVSVISICLPNIYSFVKRAIEKGDFRAFWRFTASGRTGGSNTSAPGRYHDHTIERRGESSHSAHVRLVSIDEPSSTQQRLSPHGLVGPSKSKT